MRKHPALRRAVINAIRTKRLESGLSQRALSEKLREHVTYIYEIEAGQHTVRIEEFIAISKGLGVDPHELLDEILKE